MKIKPKVFSGIQPSGSLHIGNYLGAIKQWVENQSNNENYFCIVDLHALTFINNPEILHKQILQTAAVYLSSGLKPNLSTIFLQSDVPAHSELNWILNCITPISWLQRMTQYKLKGKQQESVNSGLFTYPVLQAADVLLYDSEIVPVGEDQKEHIELAKDIAKKFNDIYGSTFVLPKAVLPSTGKRIRALNDPLKKMSKSEADVKGHAILLTDDDDTIKQTISRAVTDTGNEIIFSDKKEKAGVNNLLEIYEAFTQKPRDEIEKFFVLKNYSYLKKEVTEVVIENIKRIRQEYFRIMNEPDTLNFLLNQGALMANEISDEKMKEVKNKIGLLISKK
jgi:tryptophanyl-tRNA synthetase